MLYHRFLYLVAYVLVYRIRYQKTNLYVYIYFVNMSPLVPIVKNCVFNFESSTCMYKHYCFAICTNEFKIERHAAQWGERFSVT